MIEDGDGALITQFLKLPAVVGNVAAFFDLQTAQSHANAAGAVGQGVGVAAGTSPVSRLGASKLDNAAFPERRMFPLG